MVCFIYAFYRRIPATFVYKFKHTCFWQHFCETKLLILKLKKKGELFHSAPQGINFDTYDDIPVEATGENVPASIKSVSNLLNKFLLQNQNFIYIILIQV